MEKAEKLAQLLKNYSLTEVSYSDGEESLTLKKEPAKEIIYTGEGNDRPLRNHMMSDEGISHKEREIHPDIKAEEGNFFVSPLAGIFYSRPEPDSKPYVKAGDSVKKGDVLFIVETMKIMNEVRADREFKIKGILKDDGVIVEFSERVFEVEEDEQGRA